MQGIRNQIVPQLPKVGQNIFQLLFLNTISNTSDHSPILLKLNHNDRKFRSRKFKFKNSWLQENELNSVVHSTFQQPLFNDIISKFHLYANELFEWGKKVRSIFWHEITKCKCEIELVQSEISLQLLHALQNFVIILIHYYNKRSLI